MSYAIIQIAGKQFKVSEKDTITVDRLPQEKGENITISDVLLVHDGKQVKVGTPTVAKATVTAQVVEQIQAKKINVLKYKSKSRYRKTFGHRQQQSVITITSIVS